MLLVHFSYDTTTASQPTDTTLSDDDDDELLALRIAALESIKLQKTKPTATPPKQTKQTEREEDGEKPEFQIKKHSVRSNLLSIVTHEEEQETVIKPPSTLNPEKLTNISPRCLHGFTNISTTSHQYLTNISPISHQYLTNASRRA